MNSEESPLFGLISSLTAAIDAKDPARTKAQLDVLAQALERAAQTLESAH